MLQDGLGIGAIIGVSFMVLRAASTSVALERGGRDSANSHKLQISLGTLLLIAVIVLLGIVFRRMRVRKIT